MPGTVTGTIGANSGVMFQYNGNGGASGIHLDIGFQPSVMAFSAATLNHTEWVWTRNFANANIATINGWVVDTTGGLGRTIATVTNTASIQGVQIGTDTTINPSVTMSGICWR